MNNRSSKNLCCLINICVFSLLCFNITYAFSPSPTQPQASIPIAPVVTQPSENNNETAKNEVSVLVLDLDGDHVITPKTLYSLDDGVVLLRMNDSQTPVTEENFNPADFGYLNKQELQRLLQAGGEMIDGQTVTYSRIYFLFFYNKGKDFHIASAHKLGVRAIVPARKSEANAKTNGANVVAGAILSDGSYRDLQLVTLPKDMLQVTVPAEN